MNFNKWDYSGKVTFEKICHHTPNGYYACNDEVAALGKAIWSAVRNLSCTKMIQNKTHFRLKKKRVYYFTLNGSTCQIERQ